MDMRIPPLKTKILLESNPLKSRISSTEIGRTPGRYADWARGHPPATHEAGLGREGLHGRIGRLGPGGFPKRAAA